MGKEAVEKMGCVSEKEAVQYRVWCWKRRLLSRWDVCCGRAGCCVVLQADAVE